VAQLASDAPVDPTEHLLSAAEGPAAELGHALARAVQLARSLKPDSPAAQRAAMARAHLEARLAAEIQRFQVASDPRFAALLRIRGKMPAEIALATAAELLHVRDSGVAFAAAGVPENVRPFRRR
jgi:hypothetical protein